MEWSKLTGIYANSLLVRDRTAKVVVHDLGLSSC